MEHLEQIEKNIFLRPVQTEKKFFIFFLWTSVVPLILLFLAGYYTTANLLQKVALEKQVALVEQKHGELALFVETARKITTTWGTDGRIRELTQAINDGPCGKIENLDPLESHRVTSIKTLCPITLDLSRYLANNKIPLDPTIDIIDILNINGVVIASSDTTRLGTSEGAQKTPFQEAKSLPFGQSAFFHEIVSEEGELGGRTMIHLMTPIASTDDKRLVGVLLAHTESKELNRVVAENKGQTTESYLVNKDKLMVTPSRFIPDAVLKEVVNTPPVRECIEHGARLQGEWADYRGIKVFGASICDPNLFGTLVVETDRSEVFIEINNLRDTASAILIVVLILILGYAYLSGADLVRSARHIFPTTFSSTVTLGIVLGVIIAATIGVSLVFTDQIKKFIINQKTGVISSLVSQQASRHIDGEPVSTFLKWEDLESQKKFKDFGDEVLHSFQSVVAVQLHTTSGVLVWSSLQGAKIGSDTEAPDVIRAVRTGGTVSSASTSTISELGITTLIGVYIPILAKNGDIVGIAETYIDTADIALFTKNLQTVLWVGAFIALVFIFLLLRYVFRRQDAKIIAQAEDLSGVINQSPIGIYTVMKNGTIETWNPAMTHASGIKDVNMILGKNVFEMEYFHVSGLDKLIRRGLQGEAFKTEIEIPSHESKSEKIYHYYYGVPLKNTDGDVDHLLLMSEDISERKKLEKQVYEYTKDLEKKVGERVKDVVEAKARAEALLASLGEGMIATDTTGKIITINPAAEKMLGWSEAEVLGKIATGIIPATDANGDSIPPEKRICTMVTARENRETMIGTTSLTRKNGDRVPVEETATPIIIGDKNTGAVVIFRDVTKEREIETTRRDLLSLASHQLRTPLSGTKWLIETLKRGIHGTLTPKQTEYLDELYKTNERMTILVRDMLGVLRMEGDVAPAKKEPVATALLLDSVFETLSDAAKSKGINLQLLKTHEYVIDTNRILLENILEGLVSNAINYSPNGGEVLVSVKKSENEFIFSIKDSGIGIPKDEQARLFERFYRASNAKTFDTSGTGLGLYIAAMLAKKIGVTLSFESEKDKGSTFYVHIPLSTDGIL